MKKLIIVFVTAIAMSFSASAQLYVGGNAGLSVVAGNGNSSVNFSVAPEAGYNFNDSMAVGVALHFSNPSTFYASPYFRYFFTKAGNFRFFADATADLGTVSSSFYWGVSVNPGVAYNINNRWGIVTHLGSIGVQGVEKSTLFRIGILGAASIGFYYHF